MSLTTDDQPRPEPEPDAKRQAQILQAIRQLPEQARTALLLKEWKGCTYAEIAEILGCRCGEVRAGIYRARRELVINLQTAADVHLRVSARALIDNNRETP